MNKTYLITLLISAGLFYWIFSDYYDHLGAFQDQVTVEGVVLKTYCSKRSSIQVDVLGAKEFVKLRRKTCYELKVKDKVTLVRGQSGGLYWNEEPTSRIFWLIPVYLLMITYMIYYHIQRNKNKALE